MRVAAAVLLTAALIACTNQTASAPAPTSVPEGQSQAADLRTHLDLLLAEHVMIVAKESEAAVYHSDEYTAYTALLGANTTDLANAFGRGFGTTAAAQFTSMWNLQNGLLVDYAIGVVTHNDDKANATTAALTGTFATQFGQMIEASTGISAIGMRDLAYQQVLLDRAFIDDVSTLKYSTFYADLDKAYLHSSQLGDALARHVIAQFPDRFPGDPSAPAVESRVTLNLLMQEHSYLTTMATDAAIAKRDSEKTAAVAALATNSRSLPRSLLDWDAALMAHATGADIESPAYVDKLVSGTGAPISAVRQYVQSTLKVIDDQKSTSSKTLANDDRAAATATQPIADSLIQG